MSISTQQAGQLIGGTLYGNDGDKIGKIGQVYLDDQTSEPQWVTVATGFFGSNESYVPIATATQSGDGLSVPFTKDQVKGAPNVAADQHISEAEEAELYAYYNMDYNAGYAGTGDANFDADYTDTTTDRDLVDSGTTGHDTTGPNTDDAMTRSEEHLRAGTERVESGRARLRKYVVTENEQVTVPVTRERVTLETEAITDANRDSAYSGADITEEEHEVVLHEDRPVVTTEAVAVERVRLNTETETSQQTVSGEVRKERIDLDSDGNADVRNPG